MDNMILANSIKDWLTALLIFVVSLAVLKAFRGIIVGKLKSLSEKTVNQFDDIVVRAIKGIHWPFYVFISLYVSLQFLFIGSLISQIAFYVLIVCIVYYAVRFLEDLIEFGFARVIAKKESEEQNTGIISLLQIMSKVVLWTGAVVLLLSNMGYDVTSLVAGLGIGGVAVALAIQNILGDLFSSLAIYFDKPFKIGDFIIVGKDMGVVKKVGIKTTRIQTLEGQELVISNSELTSTRINNYGKMQKRRVVFSFGVTYDTGKDKLAKIPEFVKKIIESQADVEFDRAHFKNFGDSNLEYEVVYYKLTGDYNEYMDTQQAINLELVDKFEKEKIEFAFPTQTLFVKK